MPTALAQQVGQIDTFENGTTQGWMEGGSPNEPANQATGGPKGTGDNYLRNVSSGALGAGGKMIMFNTNQWVGDYDAVGIVSIRMWLVNLGSTAMQVRIALGNQGGQTGTWYASSTGFALPPDDVWRRATFNLNTDALTRVQGSSSLAAVLGSVAEMRILSSVDPDFRGDTMAATLGVDDIEASGPPPPIFENLLSMGDVNGNNSTDIGVLLFNPGINKHQLTVLDGSSGNEIRTLSFGSKTVRDSTTVADASGDQVPEFGLLVEGSLIARVKDVVNNTLLGKPNFNENFDTVAFLSVGEAGGAAGPDVAVVGHNEATSNVKAWVKDVASGSLVNRMTFSKAFLPFAAVAVENIGDTGAMEIAVLGIDGSGNIQAQVKDAQSGTLIRKIQFNKQFTPLFFAAVPNAAGKLKHLAVLGRNASGVVQAQIKRVGNGTLVNKITFSKSYDPKAFISFADSNGSGSGEIGVVGVNEFGRVRAQVKEIADGTVVNISNFDRNYPLVAAIAVSGVAGTGRNEIAVYGEHADGDQRVQIKDLLTGNLVNIIPIEVQENSGSMDGSEDDPPDGPDDRY